MRIATCAAAMAVFELSAASNAAQPLPAWLQGPPPALPPASTNIETVIADTLDSVSGRYQGYRLYYNPGVYGDIIGIFFGLLSSASYEQAHRLQGAVCVVWHSMPADGPFTGRVSISGTEVSLDTMCGVRR